MNTLGQRKILESVAVDPETGCWNWRKCLLTSGYGQTYASGKKWRAHRLSFSAFFGKIPDGYCVCHKCDNPRCVNPFHLFLGTSLENQQDKIRKGRERYQQGSQHHASKLTEEQVIAIHAERKTGVKCRVLAKKYGVSTHLIESVCSGKAWKHLGLEPIKMRVSHRPIGEMSTTAKLKDEDVRSIRTMRKLRFKISGIADRYGVSQKTVRQICAGQTWRHLLPKHHDQPTDQE